MILKGGWRYACEGERALVAFAEDPGSQHSHGDSQTCVTLVLGDPTPPWPLWLQARMWGTCIHAGRTLNAHKVKCPKKQQHKRIWTLSSERCFRALRHGFLCISVNAVAPGRDRYFVRRTFRDTVCCFPNWRASSRFPFVLCYSRPPDNNKDIPACCCLYFSTSYQSWLPGLRSMCAWLV